MRLLVMRHLWGVAGSWEELFPRMKAAGYQGIETSVPSPDEYERFRDLLARNDLLYVAQIVTAGTTVAEHLASFRERLEQANPLRPLLVNAHSGRDAWSNDDSSRFYDEALRIEAGLGVRVAHETHRGRVFYNPWTTARLLERFADLKLCADFSHWVCVSERLLDDQDALMQEVSTRCLHIHARVGHEEGPQVPDPRAPEFRRHGDVHERWWKSIWLAQEAAGMQDSTLTPEFGPPRYMQALPYTGMPVADLEAICDWQTQRQREQFARRHDAFA